MKLKIYSIFDSAAQAFISPFYLHNDGLAIRAFQDSVNSKDENNISKHPDQFSLQRLGEYDDKDGSFITEKTPRTIALGVELINNDTKQYSNIDLQSLENQVQQLNKLILTKTSLKKNNDEFQKELTNALREEIQETEENPKNVLKGL